MKRRSFFAKLALGFAAGPSLLEAVVNAQVPVDGFSYCTPVRYYRRIAINNLCAQKLKDPATFDAFVQRLNNEMWKAWVQATLDSHT